MKRIIAFALALAVVFGVSFALYKPERIEAAARETMEDEWVGYFFALEPFDGKVYATETADDYDFGVPGVPVFVSITAFSPDDPYYEEDSAFNYSIGMAASEEVERSGLYVFGDDNGDRYETGGEIVLDAQKRVELYECYVYRTPAGDYYAECVLYNGMKSAYCGPGFGLKQTRTISAERSGDWSVSGKTQSHSIKVSVSFVERTAAERLVFAWLRGDKSILSREEYGADALPETLAAPAGAELLVVTQTSADGTSARSLCPQDDLLARAYVPSMLSGLLRVVDVSLDWGENGT